MKYIMVLIFGFMANSASAYNCSTLDGVEKLNVYWGHGSGFVNFKNNLINSFVGPLKSVSVNSNVEKMSIESNDATQSLVLLRFNSGADASLVWVGILKLGQTEEYLNCK